jgi:ADP-ribosylglycohydrolase
MNTPKDRYDAALGCFLGACVGDAAGAFLEFTSHKPSKNEVKTAMTMPPSKVFYTAAGQITDDSELALCLAQALAIGKQFELEKIAQNYAYWIESRPFDIGSTTISSLGCVQEPEWKRICETKGYAVAMQKAAALRCMDSKANGSLMRSAPLGIWGSRLEAKQLAQYAIEDSRLSHPNESCGHAVACYSIAIASLIENQGDRDKAFQQVLNWSNTHACQEVRSWLQNAQDNVDEPYYPQVGFVKIAFIHAFRHLGLGTNYAAAIEETLLGGGDTDTNACIVGGLIGAACGASQIPKSMQNAVLHCDTLQGEQPRPAFLHTTQLLTLTKQLLS